MNNLLRGPPASHAREFLFLVAVIAALACWLQMQHLTSGYMTQIENTLRDSVRQSVVDTTPEQRVVIIDIDENSIKAMGPWPWPRAQIAQLLETLVSDYRVRVVGLDVVFPSPADPAGDERLQALTQIAPIVLAQVFDMNKRHAPIVSGVPIASKLQPTGHWLQATGHLANHAGLANSPCAGNIGSVIDQDGAVRRLTPVVDWDQNRYLTLSLAMLDCDAQASLKMPSLLQTLKAPYWEVPYSKQLDAYTVIPAAKILQFQVDPGQLRNKWILVGSSALGLNDAVSTPLGASVPGFMVQAQALTTWLDLIEGNLDKKTEPIAHLVAIAWTLLSLGLLAWAMTRWRAWLLLPVIVVLTFLWVAVARELIQLQQPFSVSAPLLAYLLLFLIMPLAWWWTQKNSKQLLKTFATYVAPAVLDKMLEQGLEKPLTPRHAQITVLSADMQNYSGLTASGSLEETAELTRGFLQCITGPLLQYQGTLDKYTGDGLVAFWGAPLSIHQPADQAMLAALDMVKAVRVWNENRIRNGLPPARLRIGIESGQALVGDLGTPFRSTYTAVGTCINSASKIQSAAKSFPCDILVGEDAAPTITITPLIKVGDLQWGPTVKSKSVFTPQSNPSSYPPGTLHHQEGSA